jgi:ribosomal protein S18 acetylase RimI-like enzyme
LNDRPAVSIVPLTPDDEPFLRRMLYHALFVPEGAAPPPRDIVERPEIRRYVDGWGRDGDFGFKAVDGASDRPVGAVWVRLMRGDSAGYGHVDDDTPELSIAVLPPCRSLGIGTRLLVRLLDEAHGRFRAVSLSVSSDNPAARLYGRQGFDVLTRTDGSLVMIRRFDEWDERKGECRS